VPLSLTNKHAIVEAIINLIQTFEGYLDPQSPVPDSWPHRAGPEPRCRYWISQIIQAGESIRRLLLPSLVRSDGSVPQELPGEIDQFPDITRSHFHLRVKAKLKELAAFCGWPDIRYKHIPRPEQAISYLQEVLEELRRLGRDKGRGTDTYADHDRVGAGQAEGVKSKRPRGRPADTDARRDQQIYDAWKSRSYRTFAELARAFREDVRDVKAACERERKRRARHE
jgi:hypothetical protein